MTIHLDNKAVVAGFRAAMYDWTPEGVQQALGTAFAPDAAVHLAHPFETLDGAGGWYGDALGPLHHAWPDIERRDTLVVAGRTAGPVEGQDVARGCAASDSG